MTMLSLVLNMLDNIYSTTFTTTLDQNLCEDLTGSILPRNMCRLGSWSIHIYLLGNSKSPKALYRTLLSTVGENLCIKDCTVNCELLVPIFCISGK